MTIPINLIKYKEANTPHLDGQAICLACKHKWVTVAPVGVIWLECPTAEGMI